MGPIEEYSALMDKEPEMRLPMSGDRNSRGRNLDNSSIMEAVIYASQITRTAQEQWDMFDTSYNHCYYYSNQSFN